VVSAIHSSSARDGSNESHIFRSLRSSLLQSDLDQEGTLASHHIVKFIDTFHLEGPHGVHDCIVTEVLGSTLQSIRWGDDGANFNLPKPLVKKVARHVLRALELLHETCGIIHGGMSSLPETCFTIHDLFLFRSQTR
jgi:serine/threonine protein kinase